MYTRINVFFVGIIIIMQCTRLFEIEKKEKENRNAFNKGN